MTRRRNNKIIKKHVSYQWSVLLFALQFAIDGLLKYRYSAILQSVTIVENFTDGGVKGVLQC